MKPLILLAALSAAAKPTRPRRNDPATNVPSWLQKDLKPVVTR